MILKVIKHTSYLILFLFFYIQKRTASSDNRKNTVNGRRHKLTKDAGKIKTYRLNKCAQLLIRQVP